MTTEQEYIESLKASGVDLPELEIEPKEEDLNKKENKKEDEGKEDNSDLENSDEEEENDKKDSKKTDSSKKRSIYDDLKDKKKEVKEEREQRLNIEQENANLKKTIQELNDKLADPSLSKKEKEDAIDDFEELAKEIDADPQVIEKMFAVFLKKVGKTDNIAPELQKSLEEFQNWKSENAETEEKNRFQTELSTFEPKIKDSFPNADEKELSKIKVELDKIAHSEGWNDKSLAYILFEHKEYFDTNFVSPKKAGMEGINKKGSDDKADDLNNLDFDPNADLSTMTPQQRSSWEKQYKTITASPNNLSRDSHDRRIII
jgi:DNA repair exonuclease SbcCD ATPase subunit